MNNAMLELMMRRQEAECKALSIIIEALGAGGKVPSDKAEHAVLLLKEALSLEKREFIQHDKPRGPKPTVLYLFEWAGEPPKELTYKEAAQLLNYSEMTVRVKMSHSKNGFLTYAAGRPRVLTKANDPETVERILNERYAETGNPDDIVELRQRSGTSTRPKRF